MDLEIIRQHLPSGMAEMLITFFLSRRA